MSQYEGIFIINPALGEDKIKQLTSKIDDILKKQGGKVVDTAVWGMRKLAYPLKKSQEGYFVHLNFTLPPDKVKVVQAAYNIIEDLFRVVITTAQPQPETKI